MINHDQYLADINSLHPAVSYPLQWDGWTEGTFGQCWSDMNVMFNEYFDGCDYSDEDWMRVYNIIYFWSDTMCFDQAFTASCDHYLRDQIYNFFGQISGQYPAGK